MAVIYYFHAHCLQMDGIAVDTGIRQRGDLCCTARSLSAAEHHRITDKPARMYFRSMWFCDLCVWVFVRRGEAALREAALRLHSTRSARRALGLCGVRALRAAIAVDSRAAACVKMAAVPHTPHRGLLLPFTPLPAAREQHNTTRKQILFQSGILSGYI